MRRADDTGVAEEFELGADGGEGAVDACFVGHGCGGVFGLFLDLMMDECALDEVARIDKKRYGGTCDDVWLGKELHDWLPVLPTTAARLVSNEFDILHPS